MPGAVRLWADLAERFGTAGLDTRRRAGRRRCRGRRRLHARASPTSGPKRSHPPWPAPAIGATYTLPELAVTLRRIADEGPAALYGGEVAAAIAAACWLSEDDLAAHRSEWVEPLRRRYRGVEVCELPPNGQGVAALLALALYDGLEPGLHAEIEAMKLAFEDARAVVHDGPLPGRPVRRGAPRRAGGRSCGRTRRSSLVSACLAAGRRTSARSTETAWRSR